MSVKPKSSFLTGVVEGFYGRPWTFDQRLRLFGRMAEWGLNTYQYGPKDDLKHRADWRSCYNSSELAELQRLVAACQGAGIRFVYSLGPGLDIEYGSKDTLRILRERFHQLEDIGISSFALLFDDIPDAMTAEDCRRFQSFAAAQAFVSNEVWSEHRKKSEDGVFLFCPTPYCGRMDEERLGGEGYLETLGAELDPSIYVYWTGPQIISESITAEHAATLAERLKRRPLIWDNYHANDYDLRRLYTGPIEGRASDPTASFSGILLNPNCEFEANFIPFYSLSQYVEQGVGYQPQETFQSGLQLWKSAFTGVGAEWTDEELELFASLFYAPFQLGSLARQMIQDVSALVHQTPDEWGDLWERFQRWRELVQSISIKLTELHNRDLFYSFNRQWWEIREEFDLLTRFLKEKQQQRAEVSLPRSPEHLPGTYRGGAIRTLQGLLNMHPDGSFSADTRNLHNLS